MKKYSSLTIIACSFIVLIIIGTMLLWLPISTYDTKQLKLIDALFLSTSAVCVTGLSPVTSIADTLTIFGKTCLLLLIQVGGLGIVTLGVFLLAIFGAKIGISERFLVKEALNQNSNQGLIKVVKNIVKYTLIIEGISSIINALIFLRYFNFFEALGHGIFHTISAFNNAGFDILGSSSLIAYKDDLLLNLSITTLVILGSLGLVVINDVVKKRKWNDFSFHTKIVLKMTSVLVIGGTLLVKLSEGSSITWVQAYFQSVTARTAGFATVSFLSVQPATILIMIILMFIGGSPSSTSGGIKTTTVYTIYKSIISFAKGKRTIIYNKKIGEETKLKAFTLTLFGILTVSIASLFIMLIEQHNPSSIGDMNEVIFEVVSAFSTTGHSVGLSYVMSGYSKVIMCILMFLGRIGPLSIMGLWNKNWNHANSSFEIDYIEEKIIIG